ncbi:MAG: hypothetical protein LBD69_00885 [Puniceicoccales bacterium]|nr:hypothetical protein [Puniceicoccales bacterium]
MSSYDEKKLILLGALALTHSIIWNVPHLLADVFEDLNRVYQAYQANPNNPQVAADYIRIFDMWTNDMGNIYAAHGGEGIFGFEGSDEGSASATQEGSYTGGAMSAETARCYPFLLGCWLNNSFRKQNAR